MKRVSLLILVLVTAVQMCWGRISPRPSIREVYALMAVDSDRAKIKLDSLEAVKDDFSKRDRCSLAFLRFQERHIHDSLPSQIDDSLFRIIEPHFRAISGTNHILMRGLYINGYNKIMRGEYKTGILNILESDTIAASLNDQEQMDKCRSLLGDLFESLSEDATASYFYSRVNNHTNTASACIRINPDSAESYRWQAYRAIWEFSNRQISLERESSQRVLRSVALCLPLLMGFSLYSFRKSSLRIALLHDSRNKEKYYQNQLLGVTKERYKELNRLFKALHLSDKSNLSNSELASRVLPLISDLKGRAGLEMLSCHLDSYTDGLLSKMKEELCLSEADEAIVIYTAFGVPGLLSASLMGISDNSFRVRRSRLRKRILEKASQNQEKYLQLITT